MDRYIGRGEKLTKARKYSDDDRLSIAATLMVDIFDEYRRAISKFPDFNSAHEGYAVLLEEVDELWDEIKNNKKPGAYERMRVEATQVGAMALRFLVMLEEMKNVDGTKSEEISEDRNNE